MKKGDFSQLAQQYVNRPGYSETVIDMLINHVRKNKNEIIVCEVGAGTGKLTEQLQARSLKGVAVEPNEAMRCEGQKSTAGWPVFSAVAKKCRISELETLQGNDQLCGRSDSLWY